MEAFEEHEQLRILRAERRELKSKEFHQLGKMKRAEALLVRYHQRLQDIQKELEKMGYDR